MCSRSTSYPVPDTVIIVPNNKCLQAIRSSLVLLEMKDAKSFRVSAQKARAKEMPKIPKDHEEMDPEKVKVFL